MENAVLKALKNRRSIRSFSPHMPAKEELRAVVESGLYAASGHGSQSTVIVEITDPALRQRFVEANAKIGGWTEGFDPFYGAPAILLVLGNKKVPTFVYDGSLVLGNMMLAAESLGLGTCWIHRAKEEFETEAGKKLLRQWGLTEDYEGIGHLAIGYPKGQKPTPAARKAGRVIEITADDAKF